MSDNSDPASVESKASQKKKEKSELRSQSRPPLVVRVFAPVLVLLVLLLLVELVLQVAFRLPFSDKLYWVSDGHIKARPEPNQEVINTDGNQVQINRFGFRGKEWSWTPPENTLRLLVLGGSSAFCFQVSDDAHTWPAQLEKILRSRLNTEVEVLNLGLPGYDTSNSKVNYLFRGRAFQPHVVLVYHTWNDMKFLRPIDRAPEQEMPLVVLSGKSGVGKNPSAFVRLFRRLQIVRRLDLVMTRMSHRNLENSYTTLEKTGQEANRPVGPRAWDWFAKNFDDVAKFAKQDGVLPVLISQATLAEENSIKNRAHRLVMSNDFVGMTLPILVQSYRRANQIIEQVAKDNQAVFINGYDAVPRDLTHLKDHVHLFDPGAKRLAQAVAEGLLSSNAFREVADKISL